MSDNNKKLKSCEPAIKEAFDLISEIIDLFYFFPLFGPKQMILRS